MKTYIQSFLILIAIMATAIVADRVIGSKKAGQHPDDCLDPRHTQNNWQYNKPLAKTSKD